MEDAAALDSAIEDLRVLEMYQKERSLKYLKVKRELHNSAREMQKHLENTGGVGAAYDDMKLRERIKR